MRASALKSWRPCVTSLAATRSSPPSNAMSTNLLTVDNPLREGLHSELVADPCVVVIFGATGDLTHRKLLPALYNLAVDQRLPAGVSIVAFARREFSDEQFRHDALETIREFSRQE